jgi:putative DNA primase/helicase
MNFLVFAIANGLVLDQVHPDQCIRRCGTALHPRSKNGAYWYDGQQGWVYLHDGAAKTIWWHDSATPPWTDAEKREWAERKRQTAMSREAGYRRAAVAAHAFLRDCRPAPHAYLRNKALPDVLGLVNDAHELFVPMRSLDKNELVGGQVIRFNTETRTWSKKMLHEMRAKGAVLRLGNRDATETWLVEGYATGLTLQLALRQMKLSSAVLVCFSAANLRHVASMVAGRKFAFADHDESGTGEAVAKAAGLPYCMSPIVGEDANDLHVRAGLLAVCQLVMELRGGAHGSK